MKKLFFSLLFFSVIAILFSTCKKESSQQNSPLRNRPPHANAGVDQTISLPTDSVELSGSGADPDGSIVSFTWRKIAGPSSYVIVNRDLATTKVKDLTAGEYEFELTVTDSAGASEKDVVVVTVVGPPVIPQTYRSKQTGHWRDASSWEHFDGASWVDALRAPMDGDREITIRAGHTITVSSPAGASKVKVEKNGVLILAADFTFTDELTNDGTLDWQNGAMNLFQIYGRIILINNGSFLIDGNNFSGGYWESYTEIVNYGTITKISTGVSTLDTYSFANAGGIRGVGTLFVSSLINTGSIAPGLPLGILRMNGGRQPFSLNSVLNIDVQDNSGPGTGHDQLVLNDQMAFNVNITLNGTLTVTETGTAVSNGKFTILTNKGTVNGNFSKTNLPPGYSLQINQSSVDLVKQ